MRDSGALVWLIEEETYGIMVNLGAYFSTVKYTMGGIDYELLIENEDIIMREDNFD